jgi:hypothetical protein
VLLFVASGFFVVEVKLLLAGDGLAIFRGWVEGPLLNGCDDVFIDAVAEATGHFYVGYLARGVDDDIEDDIAFGAVREGGEIGLWRGKVIDQGDVDVARA